MTPSGVATRGTLSRGCRNLFGDVSRRGYLSSVGPDHQWTELTGLVGKLRGGRVQRLGLFREQLHICPREQ